MDYKPRPRAGPCRRPNSEGIPMTKLTAGQIAALVGGDLHGDALRELSDVAPLQEAGPDHVAYVASEKQLRKLSGSHAGAVLLARSILEQTPLNSQSVIIAVDDAQAAFVEIMLRFRPPASRSQIGISPHATVSPSAKLGSGCNVFPGAFIGDGAVLGVNCDVHPGAVIGPGCRIGDNVVVHANAVLYHDVQIGNRVIVHATAVIGADGFGYRFSQGRFNPLPHTGTVILEDDVEIGAGTTVDRAMIGATVVGTGTKVDNQVMIAHNCRIGRHNAFAAQVGFAGSASTGDYVRCGGQVGIADHSHIGAGCAIGAMAAVSGTIPDGERYAGIPARPEKEAIKAHMAMGKLPEMRIQMRELESTVKKLQATVAALTAIPSEARRAA